MLFRPEEPIAYTKAYDLMKCDAICVWGECYANRGPAAAPANAASAANPAK